MSSSKNELTVAQEVVEMARKSFKQSWRHIILYYIVGVASYKIG